MAALINEASGRAFDHARAIPMKSNRLVSLAWVMLVLAAPAFAADTTPPPRHPTLYVTIDALEPMEFRHQRRALADGSELILTTLQESAAAQARFAHYNGEIVVLAEKAKPPASARVLRLTWTAEAVAAELLPVDGGKVINLGIVSGLPLTQHPDYDRMYAEITRHTLKDARRDVLLRAQTQMNLYLALQRAGRVLSAK